MGRRKKSEGPSEGELVKSGGDRESRALGAGDLIEVDGKEYRLRPVSAKHLCDLEKDALRHYKREYLQTYRDNKDLLEGEDYHETILERMDVVARWDIHDLPQKDVYDVSNVPVTDELRKWVNEDFGTEAETETLIRAVVSAAIDMGQITPVQVKELSGKAPIRGRTRYDLWWVTASMEGMVGFIYTSIQVDHPEVTKNDIKDWPFATVAMAARIVEGLSSASLKNG